MAKKSAGELTTRQDTAPVAYGRLLNNQARALRFEAIKRATVGDAKDWKGSHGRNARDQLVWQFVEDPDAFLADTERRTPSDEGEDTKSGPSLSINTQALYLQALQHANKPDDEPKTIEGTIGVQPEPSGW